MAYSSGLLENVCKVYTKANASQKAFGDTTTYELAGCIHCNLTWSKGTRALREGALDAYDTVLIRTRWNNIIKRDSQLEIDGIRYQIQSLHADRRANTLQITATELLTG